MEKKVTQKTNGGWKECERKKKQIWQHENGIMLFHTMRFVFDLNFRDVSGYKSQQELLGVWILHSSLKGTC